MIKLTVLYHPPADPASFDRHYREVHAPLARQIPGVMRFEAGLVTTLDGSTAPYHLMAQLWFDDMASFATGMGSPEGRAASADLASFATAGATTLLTEVE